MKIVDQVSRETALMQSQANSRLRASMAMLLHRLRRYIRVVPMMDDDKMPEHDVAWVCWPSSGRYDDCPEHIIQQALKENPELWAHAIPEDCCVVPRAHLKVLGGELTAESMMLQGASLVERAAAIARHEAEERRHAEMAKRK